MDFSAIIQYLPTIMSLVGLAPEIQKAYNSSATNTFGAINAVLTGTPLVADLEKIGALLFPKAAPTIHAAAAALVIAHPDATSWLQSAVNVLAASGYISIPAPLVVDGRYGAKTKAAVEAIQTKLGLKVDGLVGDITNAAIQLALSKLPGAA